MARRTLATTASASRVPHASQRREALTRSMKAPTGISGLDEAMAGGLPRERTTLFFGGPGTGKTVLALQILVNGARNCDEPGIFVAFEENSRRIIENAASFGWDLPALEDRELFFVDASLKPDVVLAGKFDLNGLLLGLAAKVRETGAKRVVFDAVDVLLTLLDNPAAERAELFRIQDWIQQQNVTGIVTAKAETAEPFSQARYGFAAYMVDCALLLGRQYKDAVSERSITVLKYRGSSFSERKTPLAIGPSGIEIAEEHPTETPAPATLERLPTGVSRLDTMLSGGYLRASSVLITGLPGTAKSSLSGAFVHAACTRRERALYVSFDEQGRDIVRNLSSINIAIGPFVQSGQLNMMSLQALTDSAEVQLMRIRRAIREQRATCVVIDPISALAKSSDFPTALGVIARFIHWAKLHSITLVCTSLLSGSDPHREATDVGVSTLCDTWIHVAYAQQGGERNRALTIIKSRGTDHSNQVRELVLSDEGIAIADVYQAGGEVLMGTLRWEEENRQRDEERRLQASEQKKRLELERKHVEIQARSAALQRELEINDAELAEMKRLERDRLVQGADRRQEREHQRAADLDEPKAADLRPNRRTSKKGSS